MPDRTCDDEDQTQWGPPKPGGLAPAPHRRTPRGVPTEFPAGVGDFEPPDPVRTDRDAETARMRRVIVFVILLASLGLVPLIGLAIRLVR